MKLIIINGLSCTGKTTIGRKLSEELQMPFISKDDIKELMFDHVGVKDRAWSRKLGRAAWEIFFHIVEENLGSSVSLIIEGNFKPQFHDQLFAKLKRDYKPSIIQILCKCDGEALFERFKKRSESGERHPGHVDHLNYEEFKPDLLKGRCEPLDIEGD